MKSRLAIFIAVTILLINRVESFSYYFDFIPKFNLANFEGVFEYTVKTLNSDLSKFRIKPITETCEIWIFDPSRNVWVFGQSSWDKLPSASEEGKLRVTTDENFCEIYLELQDISTGDKYSTPKRKIWTKNSFGAYLNNCNEGIVEYASENLDLLTKSPKDVDVTTETTVEDNKEYLLKSLVAFLVAFIVAII